MRNKMRLIVFILVGLISIFLGFFCFDKVKMIEYYQNYVYYIIAINVLLWIVLVVRTFVYSESDSDINNSIQRLKSFFNKHGAALIISFVLMVLGYTACSPDYRILGDEPILLGTSQSLYETKKCFLSVSSLENYGGMKTVLVSVLDKRPVLFPFMVSIVHSLFGYRPENIFFFNFVVGFLSLFLIYYIIQAMCGRFWGINGLICLASYPLFIVYTNSAGFDVFNMLCSLIFFVCLYKFIKFPDAARAEVLFIWVPLLSQSRYESILSLVLALPVILYYLPKKEYSNLGFSFMFSPLFFIAPAWLRVLTSKSSDWQVSSGEAVFSWEWFCENIKKAVEFFCVGEKAYGVIPLISIFALIGLILFILDVFFKKNSEFIQKSGYLHAGEFRFFWGSVILFYVLHAVVKFSYKLSDLTDVLATRHAIVFLPLFVIMAVFFLWQCSYKLSIKRYCYAIFFVLLLLVYWPEASTASCGTSDNHISLEFREGRKYIETHFPNKDEYIIISDSPNFFVPFGYSSVGYNAYRKAFKNVVIDSIQKKYTSYLLVIQLLNADMTPFKGQEMLEEFEVKSVWERCLVKGYYYRISKCILKNVEKM